MGRIVIISNRRIGSQFRGQILQQNFFIKGSIANFEVLKEKLSWGDE